jgi:hypothetical protein
LALQLSTVLVVAEWVGHRVVSVAPMLVTPLFTTVLALDLVLPIRAVAVVVDSMLLVAAVLEL